jgi:hypothetical protein
MAQPVYGVYPLSWAGILEGGIVTFFVMFPSQGEELAEKQGQNGK